MQYFRNLLLWLVIIAASACGKLTVPAHTPAIHAPEFQAHTEKLLKSRWVGGNQIVTLANGDRFFPAMLSAVRKAKQSITFESFVVVDSEPTYEFVLALAERARAGVAVHVILDGVGSRKLHPNYLTHLRQAGAQVEIYRKFNYARIWHSNNRDHRKILVVDGKTGFTGGAGHATVWQGDAGNVKQWRDTQYQITGPIVRELQDAFADNWQELTGETLSGPRYYPALRAAGNNRAQLILGAPYERGETLGSSYLAAIEGAQESLLIEHAYFVPCSAIRLALLRARQRGVQITIIVPSAHIDTPMVRLASKRHWNELMRAGITIYEFQPSMMHGKLLVADSYLSIIGSGNLDPRSFWLNDEINLHILEKRFAQVQREMFQHDLSRSKRMTSADTRHPWWQTPRCWFFGLIESQL